MSIKFLFFNTVDNPMHYNNTIYFFAMITVFLLIVGEKFGRGLDIPNVEHVVHYQVPRTSDVSISIF